MSKNYLQQAKIENNEAALTEERIDELAKGSKIRMNKIFRLMDNSDKHPILSNFNATERAIRKAQRFQRLSGVDLQGLEYAYFVNNEIGVIVNEGR